MNYKDYIFNIKIGEASISSDSEYILLQPNSTIEFSEKIQRNNELYYFEITDKHANPRLNLLLNDVVLFAYANGMSGKIIGILIDTQNMTLKVFDENVLLNQYPISDNSSLVLLSKSTLVTSSVYIYFDNFKYNSFPQAKKLFQKPINKTLILHDGEYKKISTKYAKSISDTSIMNSMTAITTGNITSIGDYNIGSSYLPFNGKDNGTGFAITAVNGFVGQIYPTKKILGKYKIVGTTGYQDYFLKEFYIEGSNNATNSTDGNWEIIDYVNNVSENTFEKTVDTNTEYTSFRLRGISNQGASNGNMIINQIYFYEATIVDVGKAIVNVSSALPTQEQFLTEGMDSLSPLLDRRVETLEPLPMTDKSEILSGEEGKVFSRTIDLKKYIDIRNIRVEVR